MGLGVDLALGVGLGLGLAAACCFFCSSLAFFSLWSLKPAPALVPALPFALSCRVTPKLSGKAKNN